MQENVNNGVALLDEKAPGWREKMNLDKLNMSNCIDCVLGQVFGDFFDGVTALGFTAPLTADTIREKLVEHGFLLAEHDFIQRQERKLAKFWVDALNK
jgi:hypothetical protein